MTQLLIATRNNHKVEEIRAILGPRFHYLTLIEFPSAPVIVEDAPTFAGNAAKKAVGLARWLGSEPGVVGPNAYVLADDSGLEVDALSGAPGVRSARFAAGEEARNSPDSANNAKLLRLLDSVPDDKLTARFRCVIAVTPVLTPQKEPASPVCAADAHELQTQVFEGVCEGRIRREAKGRGGFGYDPLFTPEGFSQTFAELGEEIKNKLSHRARALEEFKRRFRA